MNPSKCLFVCLAFLPNCLVIGCLFLGCLVSAASAQSLLTVALSGTAAPGTGADFSSFDIPNLNSAGRAAFRGVVTGPGVNSGNEQGIWSEGGGSLGLVARTGSGAPGTSADFSFLNSPVLNGAGQTAFLGTLLFGPGAGANDNTGIWSEGGGSLALVAREGSSAPGTSADFSFLTSPGFNSAGQTAFFAGLTGTGVTSSNNTGIWSEGNGSLALVAREGSTAPGTSADFSFLESPILNGAGQTAFLGTLTGTGVNANNDRGIWSEGSGALDLAVRTGSAAPGTSADFSFLSSPDFNGAGQVAFWGEITGTGVTSNNNRGIWSEGSGAVALVARTGDLAPGTSADFSLLINPVLNGVGQTAFTGFLTGTGVSSDNDRGIWSEGSGSLTLIARKGDGAPGTSADFSFLSSPIFNGAGQTAFWGNLTGTGVDNSNNFGIWAQDTSGVLTLIARSGDQLDVDDGPGTDLRTISELGIVAFNGSEDGRASVFNNLGQMVFRASFTDGSSGIFVSNLVASNLSGDFDGDGDVDGSDFLEWQRTDGSASGLLQWQTNYGAASSSALATAVPEPSTLMLGALAGLAMWRRKSGR
ncbi:MAG: PEP-CTERM sorting domain-containing protein [Planctomycetes bacterium]|nr:PEP-CTERM sorting domain-containing protein [Planctomycetota bacterium]